MLVRDWMVKETDAFVDAELVVTRNGNDSSAPAAPTAPTASSSTGTAIGVAWAVSPEIDVAGYELQRNGQVIGYFNRNEVAYFDQQLTSGTSYTYAVVAYDQSGNRSAATSAVLSTTGTPPPPPPPALLARLPRQHLPHADRNVSKRPECTRWTRCSRQRLSRCDHASGLRSEGSNSRRRD